MADIAANVNGDRTAPTVGDDEYNLFLAAIQSAENLWSETDYDWENLRFVYRTTLLASGTSLALPDGFRKLSGFVTVGGLRRIAIDPKDEPLQSETSEYVSVHISEKYLAVQPAGASTLAVDIPYHSRATSLATSSAIPFCPSDQYIVSKASSILLFGRSDPRYTELRDEADTLLQQMVGAEVVKLKGTQTAISSTFDDTSFILGVD